METIPTPPFKRDHTLEDIKKGVQRVCNGIINSGEFTIVYGNPFHLLNVVIGMLEDATKNPPLTITRDEIEEIRAIIQEMKSSTIVTNKGKQILEKEIEGNNGDSTE